LRLRDWLVRWKPHFEISVKFRLAVLLRRSREKKSTTDRVASRRIVKVKVRVFREGAARGGYDDFSGMAVASNRREVKASTARRGPSPAEIT
jgi:hypothetical protein